MDQTDNDTPVINAEHMRLLEAVLFAASEPLKVQALYERMPEGADVGALLLALKAHYEGRGVALQEFDGHWAFRTAADLGNALEIKKDVQRKLSRAAMETLAIVAYHQPVTRPEIENIRGVAISNGTLDVLMEQGWVKPGRRRESPGRPLTWVTTPAFLDHFGLESTADLPGMEELKASGLLDARPALAAATGNLFGAEDEMLDEDLDDSDLGRGTPAWVDYDAANEGGRVAESDDDEDDDDDDEQEVA